jgi:hypothetical protein
MKPESSASTNPAGVTVVVVDDDSLMRTLVGRTLKAEGYDVWTVDGSQEARALMRRRGSQLLSKPFTPAQLLAMMCEVLGGG